jgi:hypothetical protein
VIAAAAADGIGPGCTPNPRIGVQPPPRRSDPLPAVRPAWGSRGSRRRGPGTPISAGAGRLSGPGGPPPPPAPAPASRAA